MADATSTVQIIVKIGKQGTGAKDASREMGGLENAVNKARTAITAMAVIGVAKASFELAEMGAQSLRTKTAFENISGGADEAAIRLAAMQRATRGAVSETTQMALANRLMQMGLANNAQELEKVTTMAVRLGTAMGRNATQSVEEFALLLANQSIPRLDTFGISAGRVRERINELRKANSDMTRESAFMIATFEEGEAAMGRLGDGSDDLALSFEQARARIQDAQTAIGEGLAPVWAAFLELLATGIGELDNIIERNLQLAGGAAAWALSLVGLDDTAKGLLETMGLIEPVFNENAAAGELYAQSLGIITERSDEAVPAIAATGSAAGSASRGMFDLETATSKVARAFIDLDLDPEALFNLAAASGASTESLAELARAMGLAGDAEIETALATFGLVEQFGEGVIGADQLADGFGMVQEAGARAAEAANSVAAGIDRIPREVRVRFDIDFGAVQAAGAQYAAGLGINIPGLQLGGHAPGGDILVGERGPEIVRLPLGAGIIPTNRIRQDNRRFNRGGDTYIINDPMSAALAIDRARQEIQGGLSSQF